VRTRGGPRKGTARKVEGTGRASERRPSRAAGACAKPAGARHVATREGATGFRSERLNGLLKRAILAVERHAVRAAVRVAMRVTMRVNSRILGRRRGRDE